MNGRAPFPDLVLRPMTAEDMDAVVAAYRELSPQSVYRRFFTLIADPAPLVRRQLAIVDHRDHEVLVVLDGGSIVAVAQWDRAREDPTRADVAVVVVDSWQHRGLGSVLMRALAGDAHRHGVAVLTADVLSDNPAGLGLAARQHPARVDMAGPETAFRFDLAS